MFAVLVAAGTAAWVTTPTKADVRLIAEDVSRDSDAAREKERALVAAQLAVLAKTQETAEKTAERDRKDLVDAIGKLHSKVDGVLMLTAENRGPYTLQRVKQNLAAGDPPTAGVIDGD